MSTCFFWVVDSLSSSVDKKIPFPCQDQRLTDTSLFEDHYAVAVCGFSSLVMVVSFAKGIAAGWMAKEDLDGAAPIYTDIAQL